MSNFQIYHMANLETDQFGNFTWKFPRENSKILVFKHLKLRNFTLLHFSKKSVFIDFGAETHKSKSPLPTKRASLIIQNCLSRKQHLTEFRQWPQFIVNQQFQFVCIVANLIEVHLYFIAVSQCFFFGVLNFIGFLAGLKHDIAR